MTGEPWDPPTWRAQSSGRGALPLILSPTGDSPGTGPATLPPVGPESPTVSIVVPTLNGRRWLKDCMLALSRTAYPLDRVEIIVVDNGSSDGSVEDLMQSLPPNLYGRVRVIRNEKNLGWSPANNQGFEVSRGDILVSISNDVQTAPEWLDAVTRCLSQNSRVGVVQCHCRSLSDPNTLDSGIAFIDRFGFLYGYEAPSSPEPQDTFYAEGAAFAFTRKVYSTIGGLDPTFFMQYDDVDFSWRARIAGFDVKFLPASVVLHARGGTVGGSMFETWPLVLTLVTRNHLIALYKNLGWHNVVIAIPFVVLVHSLKAGALALAGERARAAAVARGIAQFFMKLGGLKRMRAEIQNGRICSDKEVLRQVHAFRPDLLVRFLSAQRRGKRSFLPFALRNESLHG